MSVRLALFDLDGTLTSHDTFGAWCLGLLARHPLRWLRVPLLIGPLLRYLLGGGDRGLLKGAVLHLLFGGMPRKTIEAWSERFALETIAHRMFPEALAAVREHRSGGDALVLLSASPDLYVPLIGAGLGFERTLCTAVRWSGDRLDGRLAGPNRRGQEKSRVLQALRNDYPGRSVKAYGNSPGDLDHLLRCEEAVYVNATGSLEKQLVGQGLRCLHWRLKQNQ